jgi:hypothetical protein
LNYPKFPQLSASTNALGYYYHPHYSTLSLNNPNYCQQTNPSNQYLFSQSYQLPSSAFNINSNNSHHHSMINLNYHNENSQNCEPLLNENSSSPTMSDSPIPNPPAPPLNPNCARCRFTSSYSTCNASAAAPHPPNVTASNGTLHRQATTTSVGSNPNMNYGASSAGTVVAPANAFTGM